MARYDASKASEGQKISDPVGDNVPGAVEIGFDKTAHPNCSSILWDNLACNPDKLAVIGPIGSLTYAELVAEASRWGMPSSPLVCSVGAHPFLPSMTRPPVRQLSLGPCEQVLSPFF
ncbi:hypothetical protein LZK76_36065 (plasmid) [Rhizobium leguminosarum]|nr:hypothetical protein LZK76_36065 [Rhizobium leguminosarum]